MLGYLLSTVFLMAFGYVYPAYQCYKEMEKNEIRKEQILFWCRYWILVAVLVVVESFSDVIISWLPFYGESKLVFVIYLWHPKTQGANYVYSVMLRPIVMQHEKEIDKRIMECWCKGKDIAVEFMRTGFYYGQARIFEIIHYVTTQAAAAKAASAPAAAAKAASAPAASAPAPAPAASADKAKEKESPKNK